MAHIRAHLPTPSPGNDVRWWPYSAGGVILRPSCHELVTRLIRGLIFRVEKLTDWSREVAPSWNECLALIKPHSFWRLLRLGGWRGWRFAKQVRLMRDAFANQQVCYGVFVAEKLPW